MASSEGSSGSDRLAENLNFDAESSADPLPDSEQQRLRTYNTGTRPSGKTTEGSRFVR
jgi:hypothetical protein